MTNNLKKYNKESDSKVKMTFRLTQKITQDLKTEAAYLDKNVVDIVKDAIRKELVFLKSQRIAEQQMEIPSIANKIALMLSDPMKLVQLAKLFDDKDILSSLIPKREESGIVSVFGLQELDPP